MIYLFRHFETQFSSSICYGQYDVPLKSNYYFQHFVLRKKIQELRIHSIYTSPLKRCLKTVKILSLKKPFIVSNGLKEISFGNWEGIPWNDIPGNQIEDWSNDLLHYTPGNGENYSAFRRRIQNTFSQFQKVNRHKDILLICHAGVIRCLLSIYYNISINDSFNLKIPFGSLITLERKRWKFL